MKHDTHDSLCLLGTLLARIYRSAGWSGAEQSPQEAATEAISSVENARKLIRGLGHEIGRNAAMKILMVLNKIDKEFAYLKLELTYIEESQVLPETMKRVDQHAEWKINEVCEHFGEDLRLCEEHVLAVAQHRAGPPSDPGTPRVEVNPQSGKIAVEGRKYDAPDHLCQIVKALVDAKGLNVAGAEIKKLPGCRGKNICREIRALEDAVPPLAKYLTCDKNTYRLRESVDGS